MGDTHMYTSGLEELMKSKHPQPDMYNDNDKGVCTDQG